LRDRGCHERAGVSVAKHSWPCQVGAEGARRCGHHAVQGIPGHDPVRDDEAPRHRTAVKGIRDGIPGDVHDGNGDAGHITTKGSVSA